MKPLVLALAVLPVLPVGAAAQAPPDTAALMKAIQALGKHLDRTDQRLERLQKQVDQQNGGTSAAAASPTPSAPAAPAPSKAVAGGQMVPLRGWKVDVIPIEDDKKDPVASFNWDKPEFNFAIHTKKVAGHNLYIYRGVAFFHPDQSARYVFQLTLKPVKMREINYVPFYCRGWLKIKDELIAQGEADASGAGGDWDKNGEVFSATTFSGGSQLEPSTKPGEDQDYRMNFEVACSWGQQHQTQLNDTYYGHWLDNRFAITVKGPDDDAGREFAGDELYHYGRVKAAR